MANKDLFTQSRRNVPVADTVNNAGGLAYNRSHKQTLAQIACTNTFNGTFYTDSKQNLELAKEAVYNLKSDPEFIAKVALYSRDKGYMKDMPAFLCAFLATTNRPDLFHLTFDRVITNGKMLGNVVQIARSDCFGSPANLSAGKWRHAIRDWFVNRTPKQLFTDATRSCVKMSDILRMAHPKPDSDDKNELYKYFLGKEYKVSKLPEPIRSYEKYKSGKLKTMPDVDFQYLTSLPIGESEWAEIARNANWTMTRMNLNTFQRHNVFNDKAMVKLIANRLRDPELIHKSKVFPYQLFVAYQNTTDVPFEIKEALQDAMEIAIDNVPVFDGQTYIAVDVSGSMQSAVTGNRGSASSCVRCIDVAALFAASYLRNNPSSIIMPFSDRLYPNFHMNPRDSVITNTKALTSIPSGGTNCGLVIEDLIRRNVKCNSIVFISDNESWLDSYWNRNSATGLASAWKEFKKRNPKARMVSIDLTPNSSTQINQNKDVLQIGGFSDTVWDVVNTFLTSGHEVDHWISEIEKIRL